MVGGGGAEVVVTAATEECGEDAGLEVVRKLGGDFTEGDGGSGGAFIDVFNQTKGVSALELGAFSRIHEVEQPGGHCDAGLVVFRGWGEQRHQHPPMGEQAFWVFAHGDGEVAAGLEFPTAVEVVHPLIYVDLSLVGGSGDGHLDAVWEIK